MNKFPTDNHRLSPENTDPCKYTLDRIREEIIIWSQDLPEQAVILDFGCGEKPYYPLFQEKAKEYIGLDIQDSPEKSHNMNVVIQQGDRLPFSDEYFDAILSTQVLEHVEDLYFYVSELKRVLKKDGRIFLSTPFSWDYHPHPKDYWRISEDGYRFLFKDFASIHISYDTNTKQTLLQSTALWWNRIGVKSKILYRLINYFLSKIDYQKGDKKLPSTLFVSLQK